MYNCAYWVFFNLLHSIGCVNILIRGQFGFDSLKKGQVPLRYCVQSVVHAALIARLSDSGFFIAQSI